MHFGSDYWHILILQHQGCKMKLIFTPYWVSQPERRSCSVVCQEGSGRSCIFCQPAAGWTDCGWAGCCLSSGALCRHLDSPRKGKSRTRERACVSKRPVVESVGSGPKPPAWQCCLFINSLIYAPSTCSTSNGVQCCGSPMLRNPYSLYTSQLEPRASWHSRSRTSCWATHLAWIPIIKLVGENPAFQCRSTNLSSVSGSPAIRVWPPPLWPQTVTLTSCN